MSQLTGTVRWFNNVKGYGFLGRNDGGPDVFVHYSAIQSTGYKTLREGEPVTFDIATGNDGRLQAQNIASARNPSRDGAPAIHRRSAASNPPDPPSRT